MHIVFSQTIASSVTNSVLDVYQLKKSSSLCKIMFFNEVEVWV
jgi:hypothetical protein